MCNTDLLSYHLESFKLTKGKVNLQYARNLIAYSPVVDLYSATYLS